MTGELRQLVKSAVNVAKRDELMRLGRSAQARVQDASSTLKVADWMPTLSGA